MLDLPPRTRWRSRLLVAALASLAAAVQAQEGAPPIAPEPVDPALELPEGVEAIEILGERLDTTDVQDEAQAITAFDMEALDRASITEVDGLAFNVPSLHIGQQGNQAIVTLRGIGTENASITGEPGIQFHVDGVNYARPAAARVAFFDLESVKVHRGPHGTGGGKNATGGAIHVTTRKPHQELEAQADFEWGNYDRRRVRGALNIPLVPELLAARLSYIREQRYGYQENLVSPAENKRADDAEFFGLRGQLRFTPTDTLDVLLSYNYYKREGVGPGLKLTVPGPVERACLEPQPLGDPNFLRTDFVRDPPLTGAPVRDPETGQFIVAYVFRDGTVRPRGFAFSGTTRHTQRAYCATEIQPNTDLQQPDEDPEDARKVYLDRIQEQDNEFWGWATTVNWDLPELPLLGAVQLTGIGAFQSTSLSDPRDFDATNLPIFELDPVDNDSYQYSGELRLASGNPGRVDWTTGLFYQREHSDAYIEGLLFGRESGLQIDQLNVVKSYGVYGEVDVHLTASLTLGVGARFNRDFKHTKLERINGGSFRNSPGGVLDSLEFCLDPTEMRDLRRRAINGGFRLEDAPVPVCEDDWSRWTGGVALEWRPADDHLLYAQLDTGYKAGGFIIAGAGHFDPELIDAYTIGSKSLFLDGRLMLNLEAFWYDYEGLQIVELDGIVTRTENAPEARVRGIEAEFVAEPLPGLRFNGQVGYLDTEFQGYCSVDPLDLGRSLKFRQEQLDCNQPLNAGDPIPDDDLAGNRLARSPEWSYTVGAEYDVPLGRWGTLTPRVQFYWQDDTYYRAYNSEFDFQASYHRTDLRLIWRSLDERWRLEAFLDNLEDDDVFQNLVIGSSAVGSPALAQYSPPRIYGFRVGFRY